MDVIFRVGMVVGVGGWFRSCVAKKNGFDGKDEK